MQSCGAGLFFSGAEIRNLKVSPALGHARALPQKSFVLKIFSFPLQYFTSLRRTKVIGIRACFEALLEPE